MNTLCLLHNQEPDIVMVEMFCYIYYEDIVQISQMTSSQMHSKVSAAS